MEDVICPSCERDNSELKQLILSGVSEEDLFRFTICPTCRQPVERHKTLCPNCGGYDPLAIKCECGFDVRFGFDRCPVCGRGGLYFKQLARCGVARTDFAQFVFCEKCRGLFEKSDRACPNCGHSDVFEFDYRNHALSASEAKGVIYVMVNQSMPNVVKIGKTTRASEERAAELSSTTGVPTKFFVAYEVSVSDCDAAEIDIHNRLSRFRTNEDREFFSMPLKTAIQFVMEITKRYQCEQITPGSKNSLI